MVPRKTGLWPLLAGIGLHSLAHAASNRSSRARLQAAIVRVNWGFRCAEGAASCVLRFQKEVVMVDGGDGFDGASRLCSEHVHIGAGRMRQKARIVAESFQPGVRTVDVARRHGRAAHQLSE